MIINFSISLIVVIKDLLARFCVKASIFAIFSDIMRQKFGEIGLRDDRMDAKAQKVASDNYMDFNTCFYRCWRVCMGYV